MTVSPEIIVGLDIGTTKVCAVVAEVDRRKNTVSIIGRGVAECNGLKRGVVVHVNNTVDAIKQAVEMAEQQSDVTIKRVVIGIAGDHIAFDTTKAIVTISNPEHEIAHADVRRLLEDARKVRIAADRQILHVVPQEFIIDGQEGMVDPVGMSGFRLEAEVHVITGLLTAIENIKRCCDRAGLEVDRMVLQPLASADAVLEADEREMGVALVDIGGGTTDVAVMRNNVLRYTKIVGIAGQKVTDDIAEVLAIRQPDAERIKHEYGHCDTQAIMRDDVFQIPGLGGRAPKEISKSLLSQIIEPRMEEILEFASQAVMKSGMAHQLAAGVVLTGGASMLMGSIELAERVFNLPVRIGTPTGFVSGGMSREVESPMYATAVGLVMHAVRNEAEFAVQREVKTVDAIPVIEKPVVQQAKSGIGGKIKDWLNNF
jgi:cell division protein FtsA